MQQEESGMSLVAGLTIKDLEAIDLGCAVAGHGIVSFKVVGMEVVRPAAERAGPAGLERGGGTSGSFTVIRF
jgi:hypothetical protein